MIHRIASSYERNTLLGLLTDVAIIDHANAKDDETVEARCLDSRGVGFQHVLEQVYASYIGSENIAEESLK